MGWITKNGKRIFIPGNGGRRKAATVGATVTLILSSLADGGVGGVTSASESITSYGPRASRGQSRARAKITNITDDTLRATVRLQRLGRYRVSVEMSPDGNDCLSHSYGEVHRFFLTHKCLSLSRGLVTVQDKNNVILIAIATVGLPDYYTALDLETLLAHEGNGDITQLSREHGRYRHVDFTYAHTMLDPRGTTVTIVQGQPVGRTPAAALIDYLVTYYILSLS